MANDLSSLSVQHTHVPSQRRQEVCGYAPQGCDGKPDELQGASHEPEEHLADIFAYMLGKKKGDKEGREEAYGSQQQDV